MNPQVKQAIAAVNLARSRGQAPPRWAVRVLLKAGMPDPRQ